MNRICRSAFRHALAQCISLAFVVIAFVCISQAQSQFGTITGLVVDQSGGGVPDASVVVKNQQTGIEIKTASNSVGNYDVTSLVPGAYTVTVSKTGFSTVTRTDIRLEIGQTARIDLSLSVGSVDQTVEVNAGAPILQTESANIGTVVTQEQVVDLPLPQRDYLFLATLAPGTNGADTGNSGLNQNISGVPGNSLNVNGMRTSSTAYMIDGAEVTEQFHSGTAYTPAPDSIQELKVETNNMSAQYGGGGAVINAAIKSGTNGFHGDVYDFLRNDALDARGYFAQIKPELRQNMFGGTFGGPIKKNKLFYFVDYEGTRIRQGQTFNSFVPSAAERQGDFSAIKKQLKDPFTGQPLTANQIPANEISSAATYLLKLIPLPNTTGQTFLQSPPGSSNVDQYDTRVDYQARAKDLLAFTFHQTRGSAVTPGPFPDNGGSSYNYLGEFTNIAWTHTFSPTLVSQAHVDYARLVGHITGQGIGTNYTVNAGIGGFSQTTLDYPGPPLIKISGYAGINGYAFYPLMQLYNHYNVGDALTKVWGTHLIQLGGDARWYDGFNYNGAYSRGEFDFTGVYTGDAFADFLFGTAFQGKRDFPRQLFGNFERDQDLFVQDTWKVTKRLTITPGVRWDIHHPSTYLNNSYASTDPSSNQITVATAADGKINMTGQQITPYVLPIFQSRIITSNQAGLPNSLVFTNWKNFAPRLGLAFQITNDFVARAGYGIFYPLLQTNQVISSGIVNPPFIVDELQNFNTTPRATTTVANMFPAMSPGNIVLSPVSFFQISPHQPSPYIQEWNVALQKGFGKVVTVQAAYVGSKGDSLSYASAVNVPTSGPGAIQARRPNTFFAQGVLMNNAGVSSYNSLQMTAQTHNWHNLTVLSSFTWAKALDNQSVDAQSNTAQDPTNLQAERGIGDYNIAKRFTLASVYTLPALSGRSGFLRETLGGWALSNIIIAQSGKVFTPSLSTQPSNIGIAERPNQIGPCQSNNPTIQQWFNVAAFTVPAAYTFGNAGRNTCTGPPLREWKFAVFKDIGLPIRETTKLQFKAEFFNLTNTPYFNLPNGNIQSSTAGRITNAALSGAEGGPRTVQLSLKLLF